jgi:hypothetical protein
MQIHACITRRLLFVLLLHVGAAVSGGDVL